MARRPRERIVQDVTSRAAVSQRTRLSLPALLQRAWAESVRYDSPSEAQQFYARKRFEFIAPLAMDPNNPRRLWTGGWYLWRTDDGASRWQRASRLTPGDGSVTALAVALGNSNIVVAGMSDGYILRTTAALRANAATRWAFTRPRAGFVSSVAFDPTNPRIVYATYSTFGGAHVWKSTDGGATWRSIDGYGAGRLPDLPVHVLVVDPTDPQRLYIGTDLSVFVSVNGGASWAVENTGFANVVTEALTVGRVGTRPYLFAFTHGRGAWRVPRW